MKIRLKLCPQISTNANDKFDVGSSSTSGCDVQSSATSGCDVRPSSVSGFDDVGTSATLDLL